MESITTDVKLEAEELNSLLNSPFAKEFIF